MRCNAYCLIICIILCSMFIPFAKLKLDVGSGRRVVAKECKIEGQIPLRAINTRLRSKLNCGRSESKKIVLLTSLI